MAEKKKTKQISLAPFLAQIEKDMRAYQKLVAPSEQFQKSIKKSIQPVLDAQEKWTKRVIDLHQQMLAATEPLRRMQEQFAKHMAPVISQISKFQEGLNSLISPCFETLSEIFKKLPAKTRKALTTLGEHGWFLDIEMSMPGLWKLDEAINRGNVEEAEKALIEYYKNRTPEIEESLCNRFPDRTKIIHAAFKAHSRSEYELSVPVLLAQADGICHEIIGFQLFQKKNKVPATAVYVQKLANDTFSAVLLHPLSIPLPISASKLERGDSFVGLNRHEVLHGESTSYGSEVNSLKAISLLNFVAQVLIKPEDNGETN